MTYCVLVCGGRDYRDGKKLHETLTEAFRDQCRPCLIHGGATGADAMADAWARARNILVIAYPAEWDRYGSAAGPIRNQRMLSDGGPNMVVAFPGGRGTADMVTRARNAGIYVLEVPR